MRFPIIFVVVAVLGWLILADLVGLMRTKHRGPLFHGIGLIVAMSGPLWSFSIGASLYDSLAAPVLNILGLFMLAITTPDMQAYLKKYKLTFLDHLLLCRPQLPD